MVGHAFLCFSFAFDGGGGLFSDCFPIVPRWRVIVPLSVSISFVMVGYGSPLFLNCFHFIFNDGLWVPFVFELFFNVAELDCFLVCLLACLLFLSVGWLGCPCVGSSVCLLACLFSLCLAVCLFVFGGSVSQELSGRRM